MSTSPASDGSAQAAVYFTIVNVEEVTRNAKQDLQLKFRRIPVRTENSRFRGCDIVLTTLRTTSKEQDEPF
jgi:ribosomal 30S subunit maturation factor RimM